MLPFQFLSLFRGGAHSRLGLPLQASDRCGSCRYGIGSVGAASSWLDVVILVRALVVVPVIVAWPAPAIAK